MCCPGEGLALSGAQRRLPPGGTLKRPLAALPTCKAPPYPRERRPGRVPHRRSGSRRARHARGQRDAGVPHAGGKPWAGPSGIRLAIPIGMPGVGGWLLMAACAGQAARDHPRPLLSHTRALHTPILGSLRLTQVMHAAGRPPPHPAAECRSKIAPAAPVSKIAPAAPVLANIGSSHAH